MKRLSNSLPRPVRTELPRLKRTCAAFCRQVLARIGQAREDLLAELSLETAPDAHLVRLAVNEAESLAWQTIYPHLIFPTLAEEKLQALAAWRDHQESVRQSTVKLAAAV